MPLPTPRSDEDRDQFLERCMANDTANQDFPDSAQRYAVCNSQWRRRNESREQRGSEMNDTEHKSFRTELKQVYETGEFEAVIATLDVIDADNDVIVPGAFGTQTISILPAHDASSVPLGKGQLFETPTEARVRGRLNLDTQAGREWHSALKFDLENPPAVQEWSFGFLVERASDGVKDGRPVRVLEALDVFEASPVLMGAGRNTRTVDVKERFGAKLGKSIQDLADINERVAHFLRLRDGKRQKLTKAQQQQVDELVAHAEALSRQIAKLKQPQDRTPEERAITQVTAALVRRTGLCT